MKNEIFIYNNRSFVVIVIACAALFAPFSLAAQKLDYQCYQIGNDYPGNAVWVPHNVADIYVTPEGTVYTNVTWEEAGANVTEINPNGTITRNIWVGNHGGGEAVTANATHIYFAGDNHRTGNEGIDRRDRNNISVSSNLHVDCSAKVFGLALTSDRIYASVREDDVIEVFDLDLQPKPGENLTVNSPEDLSIDSEGMLWVLLPAEKKLIKIDPGNKTVMDEIQLNSDVVPEDIAIDNQDKLYLTDISQRNQIIIFKDITTDPVFEKNFGFEGGILSGTSGLYGPLKFDMPVGVGVDASGNIVVANRAGSRNGSTIIQKYAPDGTMQWDLKCVVWIDMMQPVPGNENIVHSSREKIEIDYVNQEWNFLATTIDKHQYPDDYRIYGDEHTGPAWIRELEGKKFMFLTNMPGTRVDFYRFDGEIAIPSGYISEESIWYDSNGNGQKDAGEVEGQFTGTTRGFWVDINGTIWQASETKGIYMYPLVGIPSNGTLHYDLSERIKYSMPDPFTELRRIRFYPEQDNLMVINGFTEGELRDVNHHWKRAGKVFRGFENWKESFGSPDWEIIPPFEDVSGGNGGDANIQTFEVVDNFVFMAHNGSSAELGISRGTVSVYKKDGTLVGYMTPTNEMGKIGILDITEAMVVYQLSWGPYIVGIEDDGKSKIVVYQWCPSGDCIPSSMEIQLEEPDDDTLFTYNNVSIEPTISADTCTIDRVEFYTENGLLGISTSPPYSFTIPDTSLGKVSLQAILFAENGAYKYSNEVAVTISNGDPVITLKTTSQNIEFNLHEQVLLSAEAFDFDGQVDSVQFFQGNKIIGTASDFPFEMNWEPRESGNFYLHAIAYDDQGNAGISGDLNINIFGYRTPENPAQVRPGIMYGYFEGDWSTLPDFAFLSENKKDTVNNFIIDNPLSQDHFAFRFSGYIAIREKGSYKFYTSSDDGSQLYIGNRLVVENDGVHSVRERSGSVLLDSGLHYIEVRMFDAEGHDYLAVNYEGPWIPKQAIPDSLLFRTLGSPPSVSMSNPPDNSQFNENESIQFRANVADPDDDVSRIEFYSGNTRIGTLTDPASSLPLSNLAPGMHAVYARAFDLGGSVVCSDTILISINGAPKISFISPEDISEYYSNDTIVIQLEVQDENTESVEIYVNEKLTYSLTEAPWMVELTGLRIGLYYLKATALDAGGLKSTARISFTVLNSPPTVSISKPEPGSEFEYGETILFKAVVSDPDDNLYKVAFYDGENQLGENTNIFFETEVRNLTVGEYSVVAKAFDKEGAVGTSEPIGLTVSYPLGAEPNFLRERFNMFPNPLSEGNLTILIPSHDRSPVESHLRICDITGKLIYHETMKHMPSVTRIPLDVFPCKGIYFVALDINHDTWRKKIIIK